MRKHIRGWLAGFQVCHHTHAAIGSVGLNAAAANSWLMVFAAAEP